MGSVTDKQIYNCNMMLFKPLKYKLDHLVGVLQDQLLIILSTIPRQMNRIIIITSWKGYENKMSFPNIPDINPIINLKRDQVVDMLLASIAKEEEGLAHIIDVEGKKLQFILNQIQSHNVCSGNLHEMNREARRTLQTVLKSQMLLKLKLENVLEMVPPLPYPSNPPFSPPALHPQPCKIVLSPVQHTAPKKVIPKRKREIKVVRKAKSRHEE